MLGSPNTPFVIVNTKAKETLFLLVEDDPNDVLLVQREFKRAPRHIRLQVVNDGEEAIRYLIGEGHFADRQKYPVPNVILLDLKMPRVTGFEVLKWLRLKSPEQIRLIPVLVMSSSGLEEDINRAYGLGANSYIVKPANWEVFKRLIADLGIYWSEHVETPEVQHPKQV